MKATEALINAIDIMQDRGRIYGHPKINQGRIASRLSNLFDFPISDSQAALAMVEVMGVLKQNLFLFRVIDTLLKHGFIVLTRIACHFPQDSRRRALAVEGLMLLARWKTVKLAQSVVRLQTQVMQLKASDHQKRK